MTGEVTSRSTCAGSSVGGISGIGIIIEPKQSHAAQMSKTDEIEIQVLDQSNEQPAEVKVRLFFFSFFTNLCLH